MVNSPGEAEQRRPRGAAAAPRGCGRCRSRGPAGRGRSRRPTRSLHLAGGLVGERHGEDALGRHAVRSIRCTMRDVSTRVLPEPAPASTSMGPWTCSTASRCAGSVLRATPSDLDSLDRRAGMRITNAGVSATGSSSIRRRVRPRRHAGRGRARCPSRRSLVVMPGSKMRAADLARHAGAVVDHAQLARCPPATPVRSIDGAAPALQRVDRVLHQRLERPLEQHGVALHHGPGAGAPRPGGRSGWPASAAAAGSSAPPGRPARPGRSTRCAAALPMRSKRWATRSSRSVSASR